MLFSIIILLLLAVISFFNYVQGFFSATISAIIAVIAAVLAVSYHETLIALVFKGKVADESVAISLALIFGGVYFILRLIFDKAVPGNLRFPSTVDKVGAGIMGLIAGIFSTGIFALAAQSLPFGPSVGMYSRFPLKGQEAVVVPTGRQDEDSFVYDELDSETFDPAKENSLMIPVDDILLSTVQHASDGGALAGDVTFSTIHPDYPLELFGNRLGIQLSAKRTANNLNGAAAVQVEGVYSLDSLPTSDPEFSNLRKGRVVPPEVLPKADQVLLVVRFTVDHSASDDADSLFRFSTGSVRLVANGKDYYPLGTVDNANVLYMQKLDDFIFLDTKNPAGFDAAFLIDKNDLVSPGAKPAAGAAPQINDGVFVEVKRLAQIDLSGKPISTSYSTSPTSVVVRKSLELDRTRKAPQPLKRQSAVRKGAGAVFKAEQDFLPPVVAPF